MKRFLCLVFAVTATFPCTAAHGRLTPTQRRLILDCNTMMAPGGRQQRAKQVKHRFDRMSRRQLRRLLQPCLNASPVGYGASQGVAYVLAYYGIDVTRNARLLTTYKDHPYDDELRSPFEDTFECLYHIYRRNHNGYALRYILSTHSDGAGAEESSELRLYLFRKEPRTVLRVAAENRRRLDLVARDIDSGAGITLRPAEFAHDKAILRRLSHSHDPRIQRAARYCLRHYVSYSGLWRR